MDSLDRKILDLLQADATLPVSELAERIGLSNGPCWRRVKKLEDEGYISRRVALLDRTKANVSTTVFVMIRTSRHTVEWLELFRGAIEKIPEIIGAWRLTGQDDYLLHIVVPDVAMYDSVYKRMITQLEFSNISASISMEEIKSTTAVPTNYIK
ncbi:Lrp/AsnC family transcriptional regulator [Rhizobium sp. Root482]|uniref:Lrp/AsnC family transcriptional regulator n=1 Tax=Rhizobium sp. Root482 TaxID=1736543 RepID=UPI0006F6373E|nr:Lrp/AsnC family transcriptional regulator [Rhizobium sp. Root482]KQY13918.1 hypothetical protein ASD31_12150 [Rhizobium sp. Root482]